jgi:hypothetical protein
VALHGLVISHEEKLKVVEMNIVMARNKMNEKIGANQSIIQETIYLFSINS